jgi:hypothetical protein
MDDLYERATAAMAQIAGVNNRQARRDLLVMLKNVDRALNELDRESVECRRLHKSTTRFSELQKYAEELMVNLEKHLVFARLLYG